MGNGNKDREKKRKQRARQRATEKFPVPSTITQSDLSNYVEKAKKSVYSITRIRKDGTLTHYATLGTGFLVAPNCLLSCAHVFNNPENSDGLGSHKDGDLYYLLQKDEYGNTPEALVAPKNQQALFLYPEKDCAILRLPSSFYKANSQQPAKDKSEHLKLAAKALPITSDVVVLGYPIEQMGVQIMDDGSINHMSIHPRGDKGSVNTRYHDGVKDWFCYEFTMAFNPGNSGGPILDASTGDVVAIVHGYKSFPIKEIVEDFETVDPEGNTQMIKQLARIRATYSIGIAAESFKDIAGNHEIELKS